MSQRQPMWSLRVIGGLVQGDEAELRANFDVIGTDDLPSLATVAVTSFNTRVGDVTFVATDLPTSGVSPGTIDLPTVTVDQYGRVTSIIASPTVLVQSVTSSGGTLTVTGTTTTNVEIALGHSNSWTAAQKYTAGGKTLQFGASTTTITTDDTSLVLAQTGDTFGTSRLTLENRSGLNGALFETLAAGADLVDFGFQPNTGSSVKRNLRMENRAGNVVIGAPEFQLTNSSTSPAFVVANSGRAAVVMQNSGSSPSWESWNFTSVATYREQFAITGSWPTTTDASRKARCVVTVYDTAAREAFRIEASGSAPMIGFLGAAAVVQQTGDAGTALVTLGLMSGTPTFAALNLTGRGTATGTAIAVTDVVLGAGWGANAVVSAVTGNDSRGTITVTTSALDTPTATPTLTLTFKDGTWTTTPFAVVCMNDAGTGVLGAASCSCAPTTLQITYDGTPTAVLSRTYIFNYLVMK